MAEMVGPVQMMLRDISALGAIDDIRARAVEIWEERDRGFPAFTRQRFEDGTFEARYATMILAGQELGFLPPTVAYADA